MNEAKIIVGNAVDVLRTLEPGLARTCVTSPPYWGLRDYGQEAQLGAEDSPEAFIENLCLVFDEVWRVLADDGTAWVNLGDSYFPHGGSRGNKTPAGDSLRGRENNYQPSRKLSPGDANLKQKDLVGVPWMFAFAMRATEVVVTVDDREAPQKITEAAVLAQWPTAKMGKPVSDAPF